MVFDRECQVRENLDDRLLELYCAAAPPLTLAQVLAASAEQIQH